MRFVLLAIQTLFIVLPLRAQDPFSRSIEAASLQQLRAGKTVSASVPADGTLALIPNVASRARIESDLKEPRITVGVEILQIVAGFPGWLKTYNALHAVSSMKGITYWSVTRASRQVLFTESYAVSPGRTQARIPDPVFGEIPSDDVLYTIQQDKSFGRNSYEESFSFRGDHLVVKIDNLTAITFLLVPLIQPRELVSYVVVVPGGNDFLFYGLAYIRTSLPIGDRHSREDSLVNRLLAMADWLKTRVAAASAP